MEAPWRTIRSLSSRPRVLPLEESMERMGELLLPVPSTTAMLDDSSNAAALARITSADPPLVRARLPR